MAEDGNVVVRNLLIAAAVIGGLLVLAAVNSNIPPPTAAQIAERQEKEAVEHQAPEHHIRDLMPLCQHKETLERAFKMIVSDKEAANQFLDGQRQRGECSLTPPVGTRVRVEERDWGGLICIATFGSSEACRWTTMETVN